MTRSFFFLIQIFAVHALDLSYEHSNFRGGKIHPPHSPPPHHLSCCYILHISSRMLRRYDSLTSIQVFALHALHLGHPHSTSEANWSLYPTFFPPPVSCLFAVDKALNGSDSRLSLILPLISCVCISTSETKCGLSTFFCFVCVCACACGFFF